MIDKLKIYWLFVVGAIVILVIGLLLYFRYFQQAQNLSKPVIDRGLTSLGLQDQISEVSSGEQRIKVLEQAVLDLARQIGELKTRLDNSIGATTTVTGQSTSKTDLTTLAASITALQTEINLLKQSSSSAPGATSTKTPIYMPLGWVGSVNSTSWTGVTTQTAVIDTGDYSGYTSAQLEVNIQLNQGNGTAYARLFNSTDGLALLGSQVSSNNQNFTWITSSPFQLTSGKKTYYIQLYSTTGYAVNIQDARIRINF